MDVGAGLERAREASRQQAWADACDAYLAVDRVAPLEPEDLERLGEAAFLVGRGDDAVQALQRAYQAHADAGEIADAVRCAFWLSQALNFKGEFAQSGAWLARAARLAETDPECGQLGYLLIPEAERRLREGDFAVVLANAVRALALGNQCGDRDLVTIAEMFQGMALINTGQVEQGLAALDEAMVGVAAGETSARVSCWTYCGVIATCHDLHELRRAREWTLALNAWCDSRTQFTGVLSGICRVHRAELLQLSGAWPDAVREAQVACEHMTRGYGEVVAGMAFYQLGEVHRLRGEAGDAEDAYLRASRYGWQTQPGLALLRLAQGNIDAAVAAIRRALAETSERLTRAQHLPAYVEIMLAVDDVAAARDGATELAEIAEEFGMQALYARAAHARGAVQLADGDEAAALPALRRAWQLWRDLDVPYEAARMRVLVGLACRALRDEDTAAIELDAARRAFRQLGAAPDVTRVDVLVARRPSGDATGLSPREVEVLRLVAAGKTNQAIATELFLSEKTVARHVSNIFTKLHVGSRTAAAAYAFQHGLT